MSVIESSVGKEVKALLTIVGVLTGNLGDSITDFVANKLVGLSTKSLQELLTNSMGLLGRQGVEDVNSISRFDFPRLGGNATEDDGGEGACSIIGSGMNLLSEAHQEHLWTRDSPVILEVLLGLGSNAIVGGLKGLQELGQLCVDLGGEERHDIGRPVKPGVLSRGRLLPGFVRLKEFR